MPERARTDLWEPQGSNPLGPPGPELLHAEPAQLVPVVAGRRVLNLDKSGTRFFKSASIALPNSSHQPVLGMTP